MPYSMFAAAPAVGPSHPSRTHWMVLAVTGSLLTTVVGLVSLRYGLSSRPIPAPLPNVTLNPVALAVHAVPAALALLILPLQLHQGLRVHHARIHRRLGRTYAGCVGVSALAAIWIAPAALGGVISAAGFTALGLAWFGTTGLGVAAAVQGQTSAHRRWMTRSAALTFSAVTLRLLLPIATKVMGIELIVAYRAIAWLCWLPNLMIAEWWLRRRPHVARSEV